MLFQMGVEFSSAVRAGEVRVKEDQGDMPTSRINDEDVPF